MKTCAVMAAIWTKPDVKAAVERVAKHFEQLNEMPVRLILGADLRGNFLSASEYAKYFAWRLVPPDVERIVYLDYDMFPARKLPALPDVDFAAAPAVDGVFEEVAKCWPVIQRAGVYFDAGFIIATRKTERIFNRMMLRQMHAVGREMPWRGDQTMLNVEVQSAVEEGDITFKLLSKRWNNLVLLDPDLVDDPIMLHLSEGGPHRLRLVDYVLGQLSQFERTGRLLARSNKANPTGR